MKWVALVSLCAALIVKVTWSHSSYAIAIPLNAAAHRGLALNEVFFWLLLGAAGVCFLVWIFMATASPHR
ncbi:hypothetical protein [Silvibacterium acidisoli]|uniref:hypothetical protein n=1 Tax=Acidobacteriaceae bacterium ZG23-2 TaxID=2883246 RepID=UPI00406C11AE